LQIRHPGFDSQRRLSPQVAISKRLAAFLFVLAKLAILMSDPRPGIKAPSAANDGKLEILRGLYYALRTGAAAGFATAIWQYWHIDRGWWIAVSAVVVIQPDRRATLAKSLARVLGTTIGAVTATLAALCLPFNALTAAVVVGLTVAFAWRFPALREPLPLAAITAILVFTLDSQQGSLAIGLWRSLEIVGGVAIGLSLAAIPLPGEHVTK
jgi:uncharacterized membrane protein YccC